MSNQDQTKSAARQSIIDAVNKYYSQTKTLDNNVLKTISEENWSGTVRICPSSTRIAATKHVCNTLGIETPADLELSDLTKVTEYVVGQRKA
jgi:hypothetical protein